MPNKNLFALGSLAVVLGVFATAGAQTKARGLAAQKIAADKAWPAFFDSFRAAVNKRDRAVLREMMVRDFFFSGGGGDDNHDGDTRDEAFKFLDDPEVKGWPAFARTLAKGTVPSPPNPSSDGRKYVSRVAPPAARRITNMATAPPWIAYFEYRDGKWYCTSFSECCD
jgi:hypothetical protein